MIESLDTPYKHAANTENFKQLNPRLPLAMCKLLQYEERYADAIKVIGALPEDIRKDKEISQFYDSLYFYQFIEAETDIQSLQDKLAENNSDITLQQQLIAHYINQ